jgi:hypothetical protein
MSMLKHHQNKYNRFIAIEIIDNKFVSPLGYAKYKEVCMDLLLSLT